MFRHTISCKNTFFTASNIIWLHQNEFKGSGHNNFFCQCAERGEHELINEPVQVTVLVQQWKGGTRFCKGNIFCSRKQERAPETSQIMTKVRSAAIINCTLRKENTARDNLRKEHCCSVEINMNTVADPDPILHILYFANFPGNSDYLILLT